MASEATGFTYCGACNQDYHTADGHLCGVLLLAQAEKARLDRAHHMPDTHTALVALFSAYQRLRELGWREAMYAVPGPEFEVIEVGSTGVHIASKDEETGWWILSDGDAWPSHPCLFRPKGANDKL